MCPSAAQADELQQEQEERDDVQVEAEGGEHVLLGGDLVPPVFPAQDELRVKHHVLWRDGQRRERKS